MTADDPTVEQLKQRQLEQERLEGEALAQADTDADMDKHQRRAEKARYLRGKLQEQERADRESQSED